MNYKTTIFMFFACFIFLSCNDSAGDDNNQEVTVPDAQIIKQTNLSELSVGLGNTHSVYILDDDNLLITESLSNIYCQLFKYNISQDSITTTSEVFDASLQIDIKVSNFENKIYFPMGFKFFGIYNLSDLVFLDVFTTDVADNYYENQDGKFFFKTYSNDSIFINSLNVKTGSHSEEFVISRELELDRLNKPIVFGVNNELITTINYDSNNDIILSQQNHINDSNTWNKRLTEFNNSNPSTPQEVYTNESKIIIYSDNHISCRDLSSGEILWDKSATELVNMFHVKLLDEYLILADENSLFAYSMSDGEQKWKIDKYAGEQGVLGGINWGTKILNVVQKSDLVFINGFPINLTDGTMLWNPVFELNMNPLDNSENRIDIDIDRGIAYYMVGTILYQVQI